LDSKPLSCVSLPYSASVAYAGREGGAGHRDRDGERMARDGAVKPMTQDRKY